MRAGVIEVSPGRFRETFGRYYEDFVVGHVFEHRPGRTITDADNVQFTPLPMIARAPLKRVVPAPVMVVPVPTSE